MTDTHDWTELHSQTRRAKRIALSALVMADIAGIPTRPLEHLMANYSGLTVAAAARALADLIDAGWIHEQPDTGSRDDRRCYLDLP